MPETLKVQSAIHNPQSAIPYHFCTYFDRNYLARGLALYESLRQHCRRPFVLWILCFDDETYDILARLNLPGVRLISQQAFEASDEALVRAKADRSRVEYYWTCTPSLPLYVLQHDPEVELITYLDADLCFYSDPRPIYDELGDGSILIVEHRFSPEYAHLATTSGIYNVGLLAFRSDEHGLACLRWWRERCLEWCYIRFDDGRFGDQKYLDDWPKRFDRLVVLQHKGAGLAPWNLTRYAIDAGLGRVTVDSVPLIFYHYHSFQYVSPKVCRPAARVYAMPLPQAQFLYRAYVAALDESLRLVWEVAPEFGNQKKRMTCRQLVGGLLDADSLWLGSLPVAR